jgi:excisionase family DNA binding protein
MKNGGVVRNVVQGGSATAVGNSDQPLTVAQAATRLNVAKSTVRAWIAQRRLGHVRLGRAIRVPSSEIARLMEEGFTPARR